MRTERQKLNFVKIQNAGNDYVYFDCYDQKINNPEGLAVRLSDRHFGIGGDGIVLIYPSKVADAKMKMYNLDGSEGLMSGNAIRGVAKYLYDSGRVNKMQMTIETASGIKNVSLYKMYGEVTSASVDMGKAELKPALVPVALHGDKIVNEPVNIGGEVYNITCVSLGNPHCVVFTDSVETLDIEKIGPTFENNAIFPERVNAEFVKVLDSHTLKMRVWERGNGETWSCGTGAAAAAVAAVLNGYAAKGEDIRVKIHGGELIVNYTDDVVTLKGDTVKIFEGTVVL
jgi:carbamoyl-phosphate synthase large subunit